jgi:hypothetical protein
MARHSVAVFLNPFEGKGFGFFLRDREKGEIFEIETESGHTYGVFVANPTTGLILLHSEDSKHLCPYPTWAFFRGSSAGHSSLWTNRVALGLCAEFWLIAERSPLLLSETTMVTWLPTVV